MKVKDLIAELSLLDGDMPIVVAGYESGVDDVKAILQVGIKLNVNSEWYYGAHEITNNKEKDCVAVLLSSGKDRA